MDNERSFEATSESESQSGEIADLLRSIGEDYGFDTETCDEITAMPFPAAFEAAYGYLEQAGLDPDNVLARFMQESQED